MIHQKVDEIEKCVTLFDFSSLFLLPFSLSVFQYEQVWIVYRLHERDQLETMMLLLD